MEGFELVRLRPEDVLEEWQSWFDSDHTQFYTRSGRKMSVEELRRSIEQGESNNITITLGIMDTKTQRFVGTAKIGPVDYHHGLADLAVLIGDSQYLGKGLASAFIEAASEWAFNHIGIRKLHGGISDQNVPSLKAYTRAGWVIEGVLKNHYINGETAQDWVIISKFNSSHFGTDEVRGHAVDLKTIIGGK